MKELQRRLQRRCLDVDKIDGVLGAGTRGAVKSNKCSSSWDAGGQLPDACLTQTTTLNSDTPELSPENLDEQLLEAHQQDDWQKLAQLYRRAAELSEDGGRTEEACFRYTQAYVFALQCGADKQALEIRNILVAYGREE